MTVDILSDGAEPQSGDVTEAETPEGFEAELSAEEQTERTEGDEPTDGRPEGCPDKFWDAENGVVRTSAVLKSYSELEKKLGENKPAEVPEKYDFDVPEYEDLEKDLEGISKEDYEAVKAFMQPDCAFTQTMEKRAKESGLSQDQWATFAKGYVVEQARAHKFSEQQQRKLLLEEEGGDEKKLQARLGKLRQTIYNIYPEGSEMRGVAHHTTQVAAGVRLLEDAVSGKLAAAIRENGSSAPVPTEAAQKQTLSINDLKEIMDGEKYQSGDPATHKRVEAGFKALQSVGGLG